MKRLAIFLAIPILLAFTTPVVVKWSAAPRQIVVPSRAQGLSMVTVHALMTPKWHVYSLTQKTGGPNALTFTLEPADGFSIGPVTGPNPETNYDAQFKMKTETYSGIADFNVPIRWTKPLRSNETPLHLIVRYQACSDQLCLPPRKEVVNVSVVVPKLK